MLELQGIHAGYGKSPVLRGVDLAVPEGSVVALLGANGAGKTTLLRVASGLLAPTSGRLVVDGQDLTRKRPHVLTRAGVCHVPEGRGIFRNLTVQDNLALQAPDGDTDDAVARAVSAFPRLGERLGQLAGTMSGGEQQMLALARAYVQRPRVVLLDEVSMGLAPKVIDEIFEFLQALAAEGVSLLLVEQYVTRALAVSDWVYLLNRGEIAFAGEPAELEDRDIFAEYVGVAS
ncbi:MAG: ABC transporter ATP-binding protein [Mycobacteriales bacterium]